MDRTREQRLIDEMSIYGDLTAKEQRFIALVLNLADGKVDPRTVPRTAEEADRVEELMESCSQALLAADEACRPGSSLDAKTILFGLLALFACFSLNRGELSSLSGWVFLLTRLFGPPLTAYVRPTWRQGVERSALGADRKAELLRELAAWEKSPFAAMPPDYVFTPQWLPK